MSKDDDLAYYERRAREEAQAAENATQPEVASAHRLLAIEYSAHARELGSAFAWPAQTKRGEQRSTVSVEHASPSSLS